jgi:hypothetical protein
MAKVRPSFLTDAQNVINAQLQFADSWSALQQEFSTWAANGIVLTDQDVISFGMTAQEFLAVLGAQQEVVDYIHVPTRAAKMYKLKK